MRIFLDDIREPPTNDPLTNEPVHWDHVCRTASEAVALINTGKVTFISFDHDLSSLIDTAYDVAKFIEELAANDKIKPIDYFIHSANPVGAKNIDAAMKSAQRFWERKPEIEEKQWMRFKTN